MAAHLNNFDIEQFLSQQWQQTPLLIRQALDNTEALISPDELAGLACEAEMESRLVSYQQRQWQLRHGPFDAGDFAQLPASHWTLLVQAVDHASPAIAGLMEYFRFIPNWRLDDIMVSYAADEGSVGPHYDNYDVFLVQTSGQREWQLGQRCDQHSPRLLHPELLLLEHFECQQRYLLSAGDILYIPPGYSHWGIAKGGDCITCSVGFRAPAVGDIVAEFANYLASSSDPANRFTDADPQWQANPGEITASAIEQLSQLITQAVDNPTALAKWFGEYMTQPKYDADIIEPTEKAQSVQAQLGRDTPVKRDPGSRFAYNNDPHMPGTTHLFINGQYHELDSKQHALAQLLCGQVSFDASELLGWIQRADTQVLLLDLFATGCLYFDDHCDS
jgi:50S ribosomal protein L16 3-hydroxylase